MRQIPVFLLTAVMVFSLNACGSKEKRQATDQEETTTERTAPESNTAEDMGDRPMMTASALVGLLASPTDEEQAQACGLTLLYKETGRDEEEGIDTEVIVYGRDIEKGKKKDDGYEMECLSDHACYLSYQTDTSQQASLCFRSEADANGFLKGLEAEGVVVCHDTYFIPADPLPDGQTVWVESIQDYNISYELSKPVLEDGFYVIHIAYYA